jgi:putative Holliday junction resolvase
MRTLGLDIGDKKTGVAISDPEGILAIPLTVIERRSREDVITEVIKLVERYQVECIVVGLPYSLNGHLTQQSKKVEAFIEKLQSVIAVSQSPEPKLRAEGVPISEGEAKQPRLSGVNIEIWDERLSTVVAEKLMAEAGTRKDKRKQHQDALAAAIILQGFLDSSNKDC